MSSRLGATIELMKHDLVEGIEGNNLVADTVRAFRNGIIALWHGVNGIIPSIANAFGRQEFSVNPREGILDGTRTSIQKVFQTKGIVGKASAAFFELTDGPVDDFILQPLGGAKWTIEPSGNG